MRSAKASICRVLALLGVLAAGLAPTLVAGAISESAFHQTLDLAQRVYRGEFLARNLRLQLQGYWHRDERHASASQQEDPIGRIAVISITGGIARDPAITRDAFALITCHEIGHHLAGPPQRWGFSAEGQADYFAASECLRRLLPLLPDHAATAMQPIPRRLEIECDSAFDTNDEAYLCLRIIMAGEALSNYFATRIGSHPPEIGSRSPHTVATTRFLSADPQCRLDTYRAAALCNHRANHQLAPHLRWLCTDAARQRAALRPSCWYRG